MCTDDDTVPRSVLALGAREIDSADEVDVALGDTIVRDGGVPMTPRAAAPIDLPPVPAALLPHYRFRVGEGFPIEIDRAVHIGRRPGPPRVPVPVSPLLVTVDSPSGGISATHLELREEGAAVVVTDMRTLNGSDVRVPGSPRRNLRQGESLVVTPGTVIDLGEGVVVEILRPARLGGMR